MAFKMKKPTFYYGGSKTKTTMYQMKDKGQATGETQETWEPAYEGGDHSWKDLQKMSKAQLVKRFVKETAKNIENDLIKKGYKKKAGEAGPIKHIITDPRKTTGHDKHNERHANNPNYTHGTSREKFPR